MSTQNEAAGPPENYTGVSPQKKKNCASRKVLVTIMLMHHREGGTPEACSLSAARSWWFSPQLVIPNLIYSSLCLYVQGNLPFRASSFNMGARSNACAASSLIGAISLIGATVH